MTNTIKYIQRNRQSGDNRPRRNTSEPIPCPTDLLCKGSSPREQPGMKNRTRSKPCPHRQGATQPRPRHARPAQAAQASKRRTPRPRPAHAAEGTSHAAHPHSGRALATLPRSAAHTMHAPPRQRRGPRDKRNSPFPTQAAKGLSQVLCRSCAIGALVSGSVVQTNMGLRLRADVLPKAQWAEGWAAGIWAWFPVPVGVCLSALVLRVFGCWADAEQVRFRVAGARSYPLGTSEGRGREGALRPPAACPQGVGESWLRAASLTEKGFQGLDPSGRLLARA